MEVCDIVQEAVIKTVTKKKNCKKAKWLPFITTNKASGGDGIPAELFQILKDDAVKSAALNMPANLENSAVATGVEKTTLQFSFQSQRRAVPKDFQTSAQLYSFHMLAR